MPPQLFACLLKLLKKVGVEGRSEKKGRRRVSQKREENDTPEDHETRDNAGTHTNTEGRRQTHRLTSVGRQHSAGFWGPLSPLASWYKIHLTEWHPLLTRLGIRRGTLLPAEPAAFRRAGWNVQSVPPLQKAFSYARYLPASQQGLGFTLDFPVLPEHRCYIYPSPLYWKCYLSPVKGSLTSPQMLCLLS